MEEKDPLIERYRALNEDNPWKNLDPPTAWISKIVGDQQPYNALPPAEGTVTYAVNVLQSLVWPGATTVSQVSF